MKKILLTVNNQCSDITEDNTQRPYAVNLFSYPVQSRGKGCTCFCAVILFNGN